MGSNAEGMDAVQVGDSLGAAFCKLLKDGSDSPSSAKGCAKANLRLKRLQAIGILTGSMPPLDSSLLDGLVCHWLTGLGRALEPTVDSFRRITQDWLERQCRVDQPVEAFTSRLWHQGSGIASLDHCATCDLSHQLPEAACDFPSNLLRGVIQQWIQQLVTRPRWTHLQPIVPGNPPVPIQTAYQPPRLHRFLTPHDHVEFRQGLTTGAGDWVEQDLLQLLVGFEPIVWIQGEPGSGKSTLIQWLIYELIHQEAWPGLLPIVVDFKSYSAHCSRHGYATLTEFFLTAFDPSRTIRISGGAAAFTAQTSRPRCVFLLDEWTQCDGPLREAVWQEVQLLAKNHKVIVTSRAEDSPFPTSKRNQLAVFSLKYEPTSEQRRKLDTCHLRPTAWHVRAASASELHSAASCEDNPCQFVAGVIHCLWQRHNVLAGTGEQLQPAHWQVLESFALALMEQASESPYQYAVELERLCEQQNVSAGPLLASRFVTRLAHDPIRLQFAQPAYLLFFAASAITHFNNRSIESELLNRWSCSRNGPAALAHVAVSGARWKRHVMGFARQAVEQPDLFGHRLLRFAEVVGVAAVRQSPARKQFLICLRDAFQRPCPPMVQHAADQAIRSLAGIRKATLVDRVQERPKSSVATLKRFVMTPFTDPGIDAVLESLADQAWPCGHDLLVEMVADERLPLSKRQLAWRVIQQQPAALMTGPLLDWLDGQWTHRSVTGRADTNAHCKSFWRMLSEDQWLVVLRLFAGGGRSIDRPWLRWISHDAPSTVHRLLALEILVVVLESKSAMRAADTVGKWLAELVDIIQKDSDRQGELSPAEDAAWARCVKCIPVSWHEQLRSSPAWQELVWLLNQFLQDQTVHHWPTVHRIASLLAKMYDATDRATGKRLIQVCVSLRVNAKDRCSVRYRNQMIQSWLEALIMDDPEVLYEFDLDNAIYREALESVVWQRGWLVFSDRIMDGEGAVIGSRLLETENLVDGDTPHIVQQIAKQLPQRQQAAFLSYCQMVSAGGASYLQNAPEKIYGDMVLLLQTEVSSRVGERLQHLYPDAQPPSFESWRKNLQRVFDRFRDDPDTTAHLRQLGLGSGRRKPR